jgi:hypothetical protein
MMDNNVDAYRKSYKLRLSAGRSKNCIEVTFPFPVVEKEARKLGLSVDQFIEQYQAVAQYNGFDGVLYQFEKIEAVGGELDAK